MINIDLDADLHMEAGFPSFYSRVRIEKVEEGFVYFRRVSASAALREQLAGVAEHDERLKYQEHRTAQP